MRVLFILFFSFTFFNIAFSQCENKVEVRDTYVYQNSNAQASGAIEVSIETNDGFICRLNVEKGSGPEQVQVKRGQNNSTILFEGLELDKTYQVYVEFIAGEDNLCNRLQRSGIIIEAE